MPTQLTDLEVHEVSLVPAPANPGARVLMFKRDGMIGKALSALGFGGERTSTVAEDLTKASAALEKGVGEILSDESLDVTAKSAVLAELFADYTKHVDATVPAGIEKALAGAGFTADEPTITKGAEMAEETAAAAEETVGKADAEAAPAAVEAPAVEAPAVEKSAAEDVTKALADAVAKAAELEAEIAKRDEAIAKANEEKALAEVTKRVAAFGGNEQLARDLRAVEKSDAEVAKRFEGVLKAAAEQAKVSKLFAEFGTSQGADATTPKAQMLAKVAELRKADTSLTSDAAAIARIAERSEYRDLWNAYKAAGTQAA